jgi:hypothetical protein
MGASNGLYGIALMIGAPNGAFGEKGVDILEKIGNRGEI